MKKTISLIIVFVLLIAPCFCDALSVHTVYAEENEGVPIDIYLIAGQSNAAGYSGAGMPPTRIFSNVMYAGQTDRLMDSGAATQSFLTYDSFQASVKFGLGYLTTCMGPEYGMAKVLNSHYSESGKALIFKSAAGGTTLCDYGEGASSFYGNWYPRSLWEDGYVPDLTPGNTDPTGVQYALFVENFKIVYNELVNNGYAPTVKGMVWMQGESDMWQLNASGRTYAELLKIFIADIRADLAEIASEEGLLDMPFVIGKIPTTSVSYNNPNAYAINAMQQQVADEMDGVSAVETADLIIVKEDGTYKGWDQYHFHLDDMEILGERFGEALLDLPTIPDQRVTVTVENDDSAGEVYTRFSLTQLVGTKISFYITPAQGKEVDKVIFNGTEISASSDGKYEITTVEGENVLKVEYKDAEIPEDTDPTEKPNVPPDGTDTSNDAENGIFDSIIHFISSIISAIADLIRQIFD